jgi:predicted MFS family arabinose efflux permease
MATSRAASPVTELSQRVSAPWWVLLVLTAMYALNLLDRQLLPMLAQSLKAEFALSDTQLGLLSGIVFALFYMSVAVPIASFADRANRVRIVAISCLLWSLFTALTGMCTSVWQLFLARIGVGIGEAGGTAPSYSVVADYFPPRQRSAAMAILNLGLPLGIGAGIALAGMVGAGFGWRTAFFVASTPGVLLSAVLALTVIEPRRGRLDAAAHTLGQAEPFLHSLRTFVRTPLLVRATIATSLAAAAFVGLSSWAPTYLIRARGMSLREVGLYWSLISAVAMSIGLGFGGFLADRLSVRYARAIAYVPALALLAAAPTLALALQFHQWTYALVFLFLPTMLGICYSGPATAIIQNSSRPGQRATISALYLFCANIVGHGGGPLLVGYVSDRLTPLYHGNSLAMALLTLLPVYGLAAAAYVWTAKAIPKATPATQ